MPNNNINNNSANNHGGQGVSPNSLDVLRAPFNFVPLPEKVFIPDWGEQVSQDYPFEDGVSGKIKLTITAKNDIFVRDGSAGKDKSSAFCNINGTCFIPGSSIKGALRSVLEIVTFGKISRFNNDSFSIRDLNDQGYKSMMQNKVKAGWLILRNGKYYINECDRFERISAKEIDSICDNNAMQTFIRGKINPKTGKYKIEDTSAIAKYKAFFSGSGDKLSIDNYLIDITEDGVTIQYIVLSGQSSVYTEGSKFSKFKEFLFPSFPCDEKGRLVFNSKHEGWNEVCEEDFNSFLSIHKNSLDYTEFWAKVLDKGKPVPIFYAKEKERYHLGLTYMFKYPAKNNVRRAIPERFLTDRHDMAELIFGYAEKDSALKGRVHFGHASIDKSFGQQSERSVILGEPHPSYYPLYLKDKGVANQNWDSADIEIAGYKRYPTRQAAFVPGTPKSKQTTEFKALKKGATFNSEITFHNLKREELGALIYTIQCLKYHQLGGIKPYGYGKVDMKIKSLTIRTIELASVDAMQRNTVCDENQIKGYTESFKNCISKYIGKDFETCENVKELKSMADGITLGHEGNFTYMSLQEYRKAKDPYKNGRAHFVKFSKNSKK